MKNERRPKTTRIAAHPAEKIDQKTAGPNGKNNGRPARGSRVSNDTKEYMDGSSLPEQNPNPVMRFTRDGQPLFGNLAATSLLGLSSDRPAPEDWRMSVRSSFESGSNYEVEIGHNGKTFSALFVPVQEAGYVNVYCRDITAHKQTEDALRRSEERFRLAADASDALVYEVDLSSGATAIVYGMERVAGYDPQKTVASSEWWHSLIHPDDLSLHLTQLEVLLQTSDRDVCEYRLRHKNGDWIHVQDHRLVIRDPAGKPIRLIGAVTDITQRKQMEQALARERELFRRLFETMPVMSSMYEPETDSMRLNAELERVTGWKAEEVTVVSLLEALYPNATYRQEVLGQMAAAAGRNEWVDVRMRTRDGRILDTLWANISLTDGEKLVTGISLGIDITERKRMEEALRIENERFMRFANSNIVGIIIADPKGRVNFANDYYLRLLGVTRQDFEEGKVDWRKFTPPEWLHTDEKAIRELRERGVCEPYEKEYIRADGTRVPIYLADAMLPGPGEEIVAFVLDISERKRMEASLRESQARLTQELADTKQLQVISSQLIQEDNIDAMYEKIIRAAMALMRSDMGSLQMLYPEKNQLHLLNAQGFDPASAKFWEWVNVDSGSTCALSLQTGGRVIVRDVESSEFIAGTEDLHFYRLSNIRAVQSTPLISREGQIVGMISTHWHEPHQPLERELQLLDVLARQAADLIERKLSEAELTEFARQQAALFQLAERLQHSQEPDEIYDAALDAILDGLQCNRASILLLDESERMRFVAWRSLSDVYRQATDGHSPWMPDEKNPEPIYTSHVDMAEFSDELKAVIKAEGIGALAFIPLVSNGKLIGKFMVYFDERHEFSDAERDLSMTIARQLAFGLDRQWAEEKLRISEDRLRLAVEAGNIGIWDIDLRRRERIWSKEGKAIYGLGPDEFLDYPRQLELTHPEDRELVDKMVTAFRDQGTLKQLNLEHRIQHPDGSIHWVEVHGEAIYEDESQPVRLIGTILDITRRKHADEALRANESLYRAIARSIPGGGVYVVDKDLRYLVAEGPVTQAFGLTRQMLEGHTVSEVFSGEQAIRLTDRLKRNFAGETLSYETHHKGRTFWTQQAPIENSREWVIIVTIDITERKKAEESLKQSEERFRQFMEHLPGLAWIKDIQGRYVYANAAAQKAFRTPHQMLYGKRDSEIFSAEIASQFMKNDERALAEGGVQVIETLEHDDGVHHSLVTKFPIAGLEENIELIGGIAIDITERRRAEDALRHSEERMRLAIESNRMVAWEWDPLADQVTTSTNITEVYGMSEVDGAAQAFALIWPEDLPAHQAKIDRVMREGGEYHSEFRITRPIDGKVMWMEEWASALSSGDGIVTRLVGIVTDVTERKLAEQDLKQARAEAEATADRMAHLQEITAALVRSVTPTELAELILEQGTLASGAAAGILVEVVNHGQDTKTLAALGYPEAVLRREPVSLSVSTPLSDCIQTKQATWIGSQEEFAEQYPALAEFRRGLGNEAMVALPLIVGGSVIGALAFSFAEERNFLLEERGFLLAVAQQCAQALERVRAAEALRESEERYRFIVESTSDGIWQIDLREPMPLTLSEDEQLDWYYRHAVIRQCNLELAHMYGYDSIEPLIGLPMSVVMPFEQNHELSRQFIRANYRLVDAESREKDRDGRDLVFLNNMIGIIKDEKLIGEWGTNRDITQRKRAEDGLTLLAEISELTRDAEDPLALMAVVSDTVGRYFKVKRCLFNEIDVEDDLEVIHHDYHDGLESVRGIHTLTEYSNITSTEMRQGKTVVNFDSQLDPRTAPDYERSYAPNGERAYVAVPMMRDEQWVASLWVSNDTPRQWSDDEVALLETVAERTWTAVEKLRINAALRDSEERLRVTFNTTAVGFATLTPDTHFVDVNQAFCRIVGYTREELLTMNFDYLTHPDYVKSTRDHMDQLLSGEVSSFVIEKLYLRKDGSEVWVQNSVSLVRDVDEHPLHLIVISQDITERKRIEEELYRLNLELEERVEKRTRELQAASELRRMAIVERRQAQDRFARSFNASPAAMTITRFEDGMYRNVNPRFTELLEYNLEDVIGHTSLELNIYRNPQERMDLLKTIRSNKGRWDYETQLQTRTGKHLDVTISVVEIELEAEPHILSMITDVTERNQILAALRASEQQLRTLFDVLPVGVSYVSSDGHVIESNRTLEKIIDITRDELDDGIHRKRQYIRADGTPMPPAEFASTRAMVEGRTIKNVETGIIKEGGQVIWTSVSATPISMPEPGVVVITVDVTERKHMDDELRRSHRRYQVLSQRLVEIQEEERRTISRELHDRVGQSLAALNLNLNFMNQTVPANTPAPIKTRIKDAIQLTEETVVTIRDVMANLRPPALDDYGLEAALNAYADTFSRRFGIRVDLVKPAELLPRFNSNIELTLLRIAQEALTNVAKHSHASKATLRLAIQNDAVHLTIEDNGEGIRSWQKANRPGSHGLKIMRERAETFGGTLQVQSFNQKGTRIEVRIPIQHDVQSKARTGTD